MKNKTIGKLQIILGIVFLVLVLAGGFFVIKYIEVDGFVTAVKGVTANWGNIHTEYNMSEGYASGMLVGEVTNLALIARFGFGITILVILNGLILSAILITQGMKNVKMKN
tara:strand:- start:199 stop:531 length:333 start_codon:yes stop_codon:yes gene_type:complete